MSDISEVDKEIGDSLHGILEYNFNDRPAITLAVMFAFLEQAIDAQTDESLIDRIDDQLLALSDTCGDKADSLDTLGDQRTI